jgi:hypothetical protein
LLQEGTRQFSHDSLRLNRHMKSGTYPPPRSVPLYGNPRLTEATVRRDRRFGNCPKVEMNGSKMLQDSDRWRAVTLQNGLPAIFEGT